MAGSLGTSYSILIDPLSPVSCARAADVPIAPTATAAMAAAIVHEVRSGYRIGCFIPFAHPPGAAVPVCGSLAPGADKVICGRRRAAIVHPHRCRVRDCVPGVAIAAAQPARTCDDTDPSRDLCKSVIIVTAGILRPR